MSGAPDPVAHAAPRFLPADVRVDWHQLQSSPPRAPVDRGVLSALPDPIRRWARHTIGAREHVPSVVRLDMHGAIKLGRWQPFSARQVLTERGFIWGATAGRFPLRISGFDRYTAGTGQMRWKLFGVLPVMAAAGRDIDRSAAGRHAGETMVLPGGALADTVEWQPGDHHHATATVTDGWYTHHVTVEIDDHGALRSVTLPRWGNPDKGPYAEHTFGVELGEERPFDGYLMPTRWRAGWWFGTDRWSEGEFFRATIDAATFA